ncbi:MAG TPA: STAS domain-containing protein, partial [Acidimicrobiales bacterium]|nr:STAS domain-containing protein [Acidimicrobiales bacterium]
GVMSDGLRDEPSPRTPPSSRYHAPAFGVTVRASTDRTAVLALRGEVDLATAQEFRRAVSVSVKVGVHHLVLDCGELTFLDASGVGVLAEAASDLGAEGGALVVRNASAPVRTVVEAAGLVHLLEGDAPLTAATRHATG